VGTIKEEHQLSLFFFS